MIGMVEGKNIYRVSAAFAAGTLCAWGVTEWGLPRAGMYVTLAVLPPVIITSLHFRRKVWGWYVTLFFCGLMTFFADAVILPFHFSGSGCGKAFVSIESMIDTIPFNSEENNALLKALVLGKRSSLCAATVSSFRVAGASHLLALSGMHLGVIYLILNRLLLIFGNSFPARTFRRLAVIVLCGLYTMMCGCGPSLVRAWLFILLRETALILDRPQDLRQIFCAALTIHLICSPSSICSIGFQLSYLAMVGIVFVWPLCKGWMDSKIWQGASLSICCQIFTAPLTLLYFGTFPKYFLITNLLASPLMSIVMCFGLVSMAVCSIWQAPPLCLVAALEMPFDMLRELLETIATLP